jgi:hypothetical protein
VMEDRDDQGGVHALVPELIPISSR